MILMNFKTMYHNKDKGSPTRGSLTGGVEEDMWLQSNVTASNLDLEAGEVSLSLQEKNVAPAHRVCKESSPHALS